MGELEGVAYVVKVRTEVFGQRQRTELCICTSVQINPIPGSPLVFCACV